MSENTSKSERSWSPEFVRNRAEVITVALLILLLTRQSGDLASLPLGLPVSTPIPRGPIILFLYLFYGYFVISLLFRAWIETRDVPTLTKAGEEFADQAKALVETLTKLPVPESVFNSENFETFWNNIIENRLSLPPRTPPGAEDVGRTIQRSYQAGSFSKSESSRDVATREIHAAIAGWKDQVSRTEEKWKLEGDAREHALSALAHNLVDDIETAARRADLATSERGRQILQNLEKLKSEVSAMNRSLGLTRSAIGIYRIVLGFITPATFSIILVAIATPQAWLDTKGDLASFFQCVTTSHCLYRISD